LSAIDLRQQALTIPLPTNGFIIHDDGYTLVLWISTKPEPPSIVRFMEFNLRDTEENMLRFFRGLYGDALEPVNLSRIRYPFETGYYRISKKKRDFGETIVFEVKA